MMISNMKVKVIVLVSSLEILVKNPAVGCQYFLPDMWLPSQLSDITALMPVLNYTLGNRGKQV